jgi:hypothetical protein
MRRVRDEKSGTTRIGRRAEEKGRVREKRATGDRFRHLVIGFWCV